MKVRIVTLAISTLIFFSALQAWAENSTRIPGYTIHHNALTTEALTPTVANTFNLQRSKNRGMLNVSVIKDVPGTLGTSVHAKVAAVATNLTGQTREIALREIEDGDAIYYVGDFRVTNEETLNFVLEVIPEGETTGHSAKLSQQFFTQ